MSKMSIKICARKLWNWGSRTKRSRSHLLWPKVLKGWPSITWTCCQRTMAKRLLNYHCCSKWILSHNSYWWTRFRFACGMLWTCRVLRSGARSRWSSSKNCLSMLCLLKSTLAQTQKIIEEVDRVFAKELWWEFNSANATLQRIVELFMV